MKIKKIIFFLGIMFLQAYIYAQCDSDAFLDNCASRLETYTFIKAFNTTLKKSEKTEYSYVFSKGSNYMVIVGDLKIAGEKMIVTLYDRNHKLIASFSRALTEGLNVNQSEEEFDNMLDKSIQSIYDASILKNPL